MKSKIFLFINVAGIFFLIGAILRLSVHILGANPEDFLNLTETIKAIYYISIFADVSLFMGGLFLVIAGFNYNFEVKNE